MKTTAKCNLVMMGLALTGVLLAGSGVKHSAAPAEQAQAAKAAETLARAAASGSTQQSSTALPQQPGPVPGGPVGQGQQRAEYTGERISLNLKDVDLKDFFRLIHEISKLNVIVDANVTGSLTLVLDEVPWDQALDIVLRDNGLTRVLEGNVLRIAKLDTLAAEQEATARVNDARINSEPLVTVFRPLNYANAKIITALLKSWVGGGALSKRGTVLADERDNTLIITDVQQQIPIIELAVTKLDKKTKQISIEARIVSANTDFVRQLGVSLGNLIFNPSGSVQAGGGTGLTSPSATLQPPQQTITGSSTNTGTSTGTSTISGTNGTTTQTGTNTGTSTGTSSTTQTATRSGSVPAAITLGSLAASGFGVYAISNASARYLINGAITAAENDSRAKVISAPTIVTQNNVAGTVLQGTQVPVQTVINNTVTTVYFDATLTLKVTPQVTEDGNIFLILDVKNASPGSLLPGTPAPEINTQQATTQVLVPDGGTVVFGGVKVTNKTKAVTQVPFLGNVPVLGNLFKQTNTENQEQELLFFVTPHVLPG
jgi:type IV pilus assembly protein PilQ